MMIVGILVGASLGLSLSACKSFLETREWRESDFKTETRTKAKNDIIISLFLFTTACVEVIL